MKKILLLITSFCTLSVAYSQDSTSITTTNVKDDYINSGTLFVKLFANDFQTEYGVSGSSLKNLLLNGNLPKISDMGPGFGLRYTQGVHKYIDVAAVLQTSFVRYFLKEEGIFAKTDPYVEFHVTGNFKLLSDKYPVTPVITLGLGLARFGKLVPIVPAGAYIQAHINRAVYFNIGTQYIYGVGKNAASCIQHTLCIGGPVGSLIKWKKK